MRGPFRMNNQLIRMMADFSKETSESRKAFLALRPHLRLAGDLRLYINSLSVRLMDTAILPKPQNLAAIVSNQLPPESTLEQPQRCSLEAPDRSRDLERLSKNYDDRGEVLHVVAKHTQVADRDKSRSPLKPSAAPT
ncbi:hypothetical protein NDU88_006782 [Pleurodeles waltl]|uniref:Uncharacterized protein n=1 Tax=Pleurodeles waltl TaxID=8319 RepID=A0AAV7LQM5_PLEWA|nr:hypothetical protein NDU88_006782 [Pleurodeles waltl]